MAARQEEDIGQIAIFLVIFSLGFLFIQAYFIILLKEYNDGLINEAKQFCKQIAVDSDFAKRSWQQSQLQMMRNAMEPNYQSSTRVGHDTVEGQSFMPSIVQKRYNPSLIEMEENPTVEIERTQQFYLQSKFASKIGSVYFRLLFLEKFSRWFVCIYRGNGQMASTSNDQGIRDTYMKVSLWDISMILPQIEDIIYQINSTKNQNEIIEYLKDDHYTDRDDEKFYDSAYTISTPSSSMQIRCFMGQNGYAFILRAPNYKKFGSKVWLGSRITLYVGEMKQLLKLLKTYSSLVEEYERESNDATEDMEFADVDFSASDLKHMAA